ncbi:MAG: DUF1822 family protein [Nostoc sp.]|uniref:DUF1822 family protein n=1 Tax=Nostoc sp. TaxID=1180 RepID=UPI002FF97F89
MNKLSKNAPQMRLDFESLPTAAITLSSNQINQAVELSQQIPSTSRQWQTYIHALALFAFEQWLEERADSLTINREQCTVLQPPLANAIAAVVNLQVGEFKLCLIPTGSLTDLEVTLTKVVVDLPEYVPHFYVLVEVLEEQESAVISGFISYQKLIENQVRANLQSESDWTYQIPLSWFEDEPDRLLLYLRCLKSEAITLPNINSKRTQMLSTMEGELVTLLPQLQSPECELWEVLTWEQGSAVLTNPELLNWVYNLQQTHNTPKTNLKDLLKLLTQPAVNVGRWLWDELDELGRELSWVLLPSLTPAIRMRSPTQEFQAIITQLQHRGVEIPSQSRGAYHDFLLAGIPLRLYAVTWHILSESDTHLWTLLLVLGTASHDALPSHLKMRVSDQTSILLEQGTNQEQGDSYLFTRVVGGWDEKFLVSMSLMDGMELTLPPFAFYPVRKLRQA